MFLEILDGEWHLTVRGERNFTQPWGLFGGGAAKSARTEINRANGQVEIVPSKGEYRLGIGDTVHFFTTGGGGYGDALQRDPQMVLCDIRDRKVSNAAARGLYGLVLSRDGTSVNLTATAARRAKMKRERGEISWLYDRGSLGKHSNGRGVIPNPAD